MTTLLPFAYRWSPRPGSPSRTSHPSQHPLAAVPCLHGRYRLGLGYSSNLEGCAYHCWCRLLRCPRSPVPRGFAPREGQHHHVAGEGGHVACCLGLVPLQGLSFAAAVARCRGVRVAPCAVGTPQSPPRRWSLSLPPGIRFRGSVRVTPLPDRWSVHSRPMGLSRLHGEERLGVPLRGCAAGNRAPCLRLGSVGVMRNVLADGSLTPSLVRGPFGLRR